MTLTIFPPHGAGHGAPFWTPQLGAQRGAKSSAENGMRGDSHRPNFGNPPPCLGVTSTWRRDIDMTLQSHLPDEVVLADPWTLYCEECGQLMRIKTAAPARAGMERRT